MNTPWSHESVRHFLANVDHNGPLMPGMLTRCHAWTGSTYSITGAGSVPVKEPGRPPFVLANRFVWQHLNGLLPADDSVDISFKCHNPNCCNPEHMRAVDSHDHGHVLVEHSACGFRGVAPIVRRRLAA